MEYVLYIWTAVAMAGTNYHFQTTHDWVNKGEFKNKLACERAAELLTKAPGKGDEDKIKPYHCLKLWVPN